MTTLNGLHRVPQYLLDVMDANEGRNAQVAILGTTKSGKTRAVKTLINRAIETEARVCIIDIEGEYSSLTEQAGGKVVSFGAGGEGLNPLRFEGLADEYDTSAMVRGMMRLLRVCGMRGQFEDQLRESLCRYLNDKSNADLGASVSLEDYISGLEAGESYEQRGLMWELRHILGDRFHFLLGEDFTGLWEDDSPIFCFDLHQVDSAVLDATFCAILNSYWQKVRFDYKSRVLIVENADQLLVNRDVVHIFLDICKRARTHRLSVVSSAQTVDDFFLPILRNSSYSLLLRQEREVAKHLTSLYRLGQDAREALLEYPIGEGLLIHPRGSANVSIDGDVFRE